MRFRNQEIATTSLIQEMKSELNKLMEDKYSIPHLATTLDDDDLIGHECAWANLLESINLLVSFNNTLEDSNMNVNELWRINTLLLHVITQELHFILETSGLSHTYMQSSFEAIYSVKRYTNFLKHPKARLFLYKPTMIYAKSSVNDPNIYAKLLDEVKASSGNVLVVSTNDIKKYYSREDRNRDLNLLTEWSKKEGAYIVLPSIVDLTKDVIECIGDIKILFEENPILSRQLSVYSSVELGQLDDLLESHMEMQNEIARGR